MIGNSDWQLHYQKNTKYFLKDEKLQVIPYDFDFAAIVDAPYARIRLDDGSVTAKPRLYLGTAEHLADMEATFELFRARRKAIQKVVKSNDFIKRKTRFKMIEYLNSFYSKMNVESMRAVMAKDEKGLQVKKPAIQ